MVIRAFAAGVLAAMALSVPTAAAAEQYPPDGSASVAMVNCAAQYVAHPGYFEPSEAVTITITGADDAAATALAEGTGPDQSGGYTANADGSLVVDIASAGRAAGEYELTTSGTTSPTRGPLVFSATSSCQPSADGALPQTGADPGLLWLGAGMLAVGAVAVGGVSLVRRQRRS